MKLEGIHHITAITADAQRNLDFYARVLGLRFVKKTVNFDQPDAYHLYYGDEQGNAGSILTFFEFPFAAPGRPGAGMVHRLVSRVGSQESLDFWEQRLDAQRTDNGLLFKDPEGLEHELIVAAVDDPPLTAGAEGIPQEHALQGFHGVRAYARDPQASERLLTELGFERGELRGDQRGARYDYDAPPQDVGIQGAGTVHHIAWAAEYGSSEQWRERARAGGAHPTQVIDRDYFLSIYFREPSGVLFEIATIGPGFARDEDPEHLGEALRLPKQHEHLREQLEQVLTPLDNPRLATR